MRYLALVLLAALPCFGQALPGSGFGNGGNGTGGGASFPASGTPCVVNATSTTASTCATSISVSGSITSGVGSSNAGSIDLVQGAATGSIPTTTIRLEAPVTVTGSYVWHFPAQDGLGPIQSDGLGNLSNGPFPLLATGNLENTGAGIGALGTCSSGPNAAFGYQSMNSCTTGTGNSAFGDFSLFALISGNNNTAVGQSALSGITTTNDNLGVGYNAGYNGTHQALSQDTFLGSMTQSDGNTNNSIAVGYGTHITRNNQIAVGNSSVVETLFGGKCSLYTGSGSPNSSQSGSPCDLYLSTAGGSNVTLWNKTSGSATNTGWVVTGGTSAALPPYLQLGGNLYMPSDNMALATVPNFTGWATIGSVAAPTLVTNTNGDVQITSAQYYFAAPTQIASIEGVFLNATSGIQSASAVSGLFVYDSTNSKTYTLTRKAGDLTLYWITSTFSGSGTPTFSSQAVAQTTASVSHFKLSISGTTLSAQYSLNGGTTFQTLTTQTVGTIAKVGITGDFASTFTDWYSLVVN